MNLEHPTPRKFRLLRSFGGTTLLRLDARQLAVLEAVDLDELRKRGASCGLAEFLVEVADRLIPALRRTRR